jgi:cardiolipin synthase C
MNSSKLLVFALAFSFISFAPNWNNHDLSLERAPASSTDLYPYRVTSTAGHEMRVINSGMAALYARVDLIRRAKKTLELEYFIFNPDHSGRIILKELVKAANRGVKVRVLIDKSMAVFVLDKYYASTLKKHGVELRYYNAASAILISSVQFRNHRKLLAMDNREAITGGRNIGNEYFDLSETFNFLDRDSWIKGEIVKAMTDSFDLYWKDSIVKKAKKLKMPFKRISHNHKRRGVEKARYKRRVKTHLKRVEEADKVLEPNKEDDKILEYAMTKGKEIYLQLDQHNCPEIAFATDREGGRFWERLNSENYHTNYRLLRKEIGKWIEKIDKEVTLDSPYFLNNKRSRKVINDLLDKEVKVSILTNSLGSTDAIYVSTLFNTEVRRYTPFELFNAYTYKGKFNHESEVYNKKIAEAIWGTHSKTIVFNDDAFMIGTFNIDNRSSFYNTEMAIFCAGSTELRNDVLENIQFRMKGSYHLDKNGKPDDGSKVTEGASFYKRVLYVFLKVPAAILKFLL